MNIRHWLPCAALAGAIALSPLSAVAADAPSAQATADNRAIMQSFIHLLYGEGKVREAYERYVAADLVQHNPNIANGREAAIAELAGLLANPDAKFEVQRIAVDGGLAFVHFKGKLGKQGPGAAVVEVFRLADGKIVEHWDVFQVMGGASKNPHPYF